MHLLVPSDDANNSDAVHDCDRVKSVVDGQSLDGIDSLRIHTATDYISKEHVIRWTELFFVSYGCGSDVDSQPADPAELSRLAEHLAQAFCLAVTPYLEPLAASEMLPVKIGLRVTVGSDQASIPLVSSSLHQGWLGCWQSCNVPPASAEA